jgi:protein-ribulosamine 3-kinase
VHDRGKFGTFKAIYAVSFPLGPNTYHMGPYKSNPNVFFLLADFREAGQQLPDPTRITARLAELHKNSKSPTGKFGFHMRTLVGPIVQHNNGWSDSWEEIFSNLLGNLLDLDGEKNPPWPEL